MALIRRLSRPEGSGEGPVRSAEFEVVEHDWFEHADLEGELPDGQVVVPLARLVSERDALQGRPGLGVRVPSDTRLETLVPIALSLARIEIEFPKFTDGRGYSLGRRLRDQAGFSGELCAVGDVLRDQALYLHRSGFDVLTIPAYKRAQDMLAAFDEMSVQYQAAHDQRLPLYKRATR
jgi:uncharacterized protein (DUF934 family)